MYMSPLTVVFSLQQDEYNVCETSPLGGLIVCAERVSGVLGAGTAVTLRLKTCDIPSSQAQGIIAYEATCSGYTNFRIGLS